LVKLNKFHYAFIFHEPLQSRETANTNRIVSVCVFVLAISLLITLAIASHLFTETSIYILCSFLIKYLTDFNAILAENNMENPLYLSDMLIHFSYFYQLVFNQRCWL